MLKKQASLHPMDVELHINFLCAEALSSPLHALWCYDISPSWKEENGSECEILWCLLRWPAPDFRFVLSTEIMSKASLIVATTLCWYIFNFWIPDFVKWWKLFICAKWWQIEIMSCLQDINVHVDVQRATREYCKSFLLRKHNKWRTIFLFWHQQMKN